MNLISIFLLGYLGIFIFLFLYNSKLGVFFLFGTKFSIDLLWEHTITLNLNILKIVGFIFPLLCIIHYVRLRPQFKSYRPAKLIMILFILNVIATGWGFVVYELSLFPVPHSPLTIRNALDWNLRFLNLAGVFLMIPTIISSIHDTRLLLRAFLTSTLLPCFISLYQLSITSFEYMGSILSEPYSAMLFQRINATYHDPVTLAIVMFTATALSFVLLLTENSKILRIIYSLYAIACMTILYFTFSRTFWASIILFLLCFFWIRKKYVLAASLSIIIGLIVLLVPTTMKRFERELSFIKEPSQYEQTEELQKIGAGRIGLWNDARKHFLNLDIVSQIIGSGRSFGSHNQYIALILRNGILGAAVWFFFLYNVATLLWSQTKISELDDNIMPVFAFSLFGTIVGLTNLTVQPWDNTTFVYFFWSIIGIQLYRHHQANQPMQGKACT